MTQPSVLITGVGVVSPLAVETPLHFERLVKGDSAVTGSAGSEYGDFTDLRLARVSGFNRRQFIPHRMLRKLLSPSAAYALRSAVLALRNAGFEAGDDALQNCGLYVGSICLDVNAEAFIPALRQSINSENKVDLGRFATHGMRLIDPLFLVKSLPNAGTCAVAVQEQVLGPNLNITNGAVSGLQAVLAAALAIRRGETEIALAGGYDSLIQIDSVVEHLLANGGGRQGDEQPDRQANVFALGEGAAFVLLESEEHARRRGVGAYCRLVSFSQSTRGRNLLPPEEQGDSSLLCAAEEAMRKGHCAPDDIDVLFGDGLATRSHDMREHVAAQSLLGDREVPFTAATGAIGFTGAATGSFALVHACLAMREGIVPPMIHGAQTHPNSNLRRVCPAERRELRRGLVWNDDRGLRSVALLLDSCGA